jgi:AcrR family transcriptional regulator
MPALRSDAARSRSRILEVARALDTHDLRLNEVAREAGLGVGTVYRHFPTVRSLVSALSADTVDRLLGISRRAAVEPDPAEAVRLCLDSALALQLEDGGLQMTLLSTEDDSEEVRVAKREIFVTFAALVERAQAAGAVREDVTLDQLMHLVCGVEYAVRLGSSRDRGTLLDIVLSGLRATAPNR